MCGRHKIFAAEDVLNRLIPSRRGRLDTRGIGCPLLIDLRVHGADPIRDASVDIRLGVSRMHGEDHNVEVKPDVVID
jgi:hypothetical protein